MKQYICLAYNWHNGGGSPLYRFASNHGHIDNLLHAKDIESDLELILRNESNLSNLDKFQLNEFLIEIKQYIKRFKHGTILKGSDQYRNKSY
jgi:hypothetical protein